MKENQLGMSTRHRIKSPLFSGYSERRTDGFIGRAGEPFIASHAMSKNSDIEEAFAKSLASDGSEFRI